MRQRIPEEQLQRPQNERCSLPVRLVTFTPQLRRALTDNGADILAIYNQSIHRANMARHSQLLTMAELAGALLPNEDRYHTYVVPVDGVIRGWAGFRPWNPSAARASTVELLVYVAPTHRGRGLGKVLAKRTIVAAAGAGYQSVVALCRANDAVAARLLRSTGFFCAGMPRAVFPALDMLQDVTMYQRMLVVDKDDVFDLTDLSDSQQRGCAGGPVRGNGEEVGLFEDPRPGPAPWSATASPTRSAPPMTATAKSVRSSATKYSAVPIRGSPSPRWSPCRRSCNRARQGRFPAAPCR
jgi:L-amino acid N-acyltransferase YncA